MRSTLLYLAILFCTVSFVQSQTVVFSDNFESGAASEDWGIYRAGEETIQAKAMGDAPAALEGGGSYVGFIQDIDNSYTGVALALAGDVSLQNYSIEADVYCYVNHSGGSAYTGLVVYADSSFQGSQSHGIYFKLVADFDASDRFRLYNNQLNMGTFQYTFHEGISATGLYSSDAWHHMKLVVATIDTSNTEYTCYFDGELLGTYTDSGIDQREGGKFGLFSFSQGTGNGLEGYFDNIIVTSNVTAVEDENIVASKFKLAQNYPNPFNPTTTIEYELDKQSNVNLAIYNINGSVVKTLVNGTIATGIHKAKWDGIDDLGNNVAAGIYVYSIRTENWNETKKMVLIK